MNIIDLLRGANPVAAGSAITGYGADPNAMTGPVAPVRPPQASIDALPRGQNFTPEGNILAVIDPALRQRQQEEQGLLQRAQGALTSGGLTADGKGRSKWGAFAHGLATGLNHQGETRTKAEQAKAVRADKDREFGLKERKQSFDEQYFTKRNALDERKQNWNETPDDPTVSINGRPMKLNEVLLSRSRRYNELAGPKRGYATDAEHAEWMKQIDKEFPLPQGLNAQGQNAIMRRDPTTAVQPQAAPTGAPGVPPGPVSSSAPPAPAPAPAPAQAAGPARPQSRAEFEALPSGARFLGPDGLERIKP